MEESRSRGSASPDEVPSLTKI